MGTGHVEYHSVPEIVINRDGPEERRIAFVDDFGGRMELSIQQCTNGRDEACANADPS